jgi:hypothetical protein
VRDAVLVPDGDTAFALRLARYCARNPVALERLEYDGSARQVRYRSDKADGPTAGTETVDPLEFLARVTAHTPSKHQVMTRYYGYYANRVRGARRHRGAAPEGPLPVAAPVPLALRAAATRSACSRPESRRQGQDVLEPDPRVPPAPGSVPEQRPGGRAGPAGDEAMDCPRPPSVARSGVPSHTVTHLGGLKEP